MFEKRDMPPIVKPRVKAVAINYLRKQPKVQRNDPCPCGSGKKFKVCCWDKASARAYR
jgi:uncharacterized protein YecA (UPF0149 family)